MRRQLDQPIEIQITLKLALSILTACVTGTAGAAAWAYNLQNKIIDLTDQRREMRLQAYPSYFQIQGLFQSMDARRAAEYQDLRDRLDALEEKIDGLQATVSGLRSRRSH